MRARGLLVAATLTASVVGFSDIAHSEPSSQAAAQRYIVVLEDDADSTAVAADHGRRFEARVDYVYQYALRGYAATMAPQAAARLAEDPRVASVEPDQMVTIAEQTTPTGISRSFATDNGNIDIDGTDDWRVDADVAVLDTGIANHSDLNVAARVDCFVYNSSLGRYECAPGGSDGHGHGTHVAGTVGALDNGFGVVGMAPGVRLWAIKVLDDNGSGPFSVITAGVDYVTATAGQIDVANMSLGCSNCSSSALYDALTNSVAAGVTYAVAAGNSDADASSFFPANHPDVIAVSALADFNGLSGGGASPTCLSDQDDTLAYFSNWGSTVDLAAPGVCILSTDKNGGYSVKSGTSMAAPHVAGAAALLASMGLTEPAVRSALLSEGNFDWTDDSGRRGNGDGYHEPLLDVSDTTAFDPVLVAGSSDPTNTPPVAFDAFATGAEDAVIGWTPLVSDGDGDALTCSIASQPTYGSATVGSDCAGGTYSPASNWNGTDGFTYSVSDGRGGSGTGTVAVTVSPVNDAPVALNDSTSTTRDTSKIIAVLANDSDPDGDPLTVSIVSGPGSGTAVANADGTVTYTPLRGWTGTTTFTYAVSDGHGGTDTATVTVKVTKPRGKGASANG